MNSYVILWPNDWAKRIIGNGDKGPLDVIYGGPHISQPSLGKIQPGDVIYPIRVEKGILIILSRIKVEKIINADTYIQEYLHITTDQMWDNYTYNHAKEITHKIPRTCADDAAIGKGISIKERIVPIDKLSTIKLGPTKGEEKHLTLVDGKVSFKSFQGHFRRLSENSAIIFEEIVNQE